MPAPNTCGNITTSLLEDSLRNSAVFCTCLGPAQSVWLTRPLLDMLMFLPPLEEPSSVFTLVSFHQQGLGCCQETSPSWPTSLAPHVITSPASSEKMERNSASIHTST